jgi:hypothetical protein
MVGAWEGQENPNVVNSLLRYADAPDGRGGQGRDHVEALSVHAYTYHNDPLAMVEVLRKYRRTFIEAGFSERLPRYVTECGAEAPMYWSSDYPPTSKKIEIIRKWCAIPATLGYSGLYLYKYSSVRNLGDPHRNLRISEALEEMRRSLRFKRICAAAILPVGNIWLSFSDGSEVTI